jgi:anthranilate synthase component 1
MNLEVHPGKDTFRRLAESYSVVPVWADVLADLETPVSAYLKLVGDAAGFLLESVEGGERWGRYSFIGRNPRIILESKNDEILVSGSVPGWTPEEGSDPLAVLAGLVSAHSSPPIEELPPLHGGVVGYLGYDIVRYIEKLPCNTDDDLGVADMVMFLTEELVVFDHLLQKIQIVENVFVDGDPDAGYALAKEKIETAVAELSRPLEYEPAGASLGGTVEDAESNMTPEEYQAGVERAKEYILAGDIFQVVLSQRFAVPLSTHPFNVYRALRLLNPSPYMYYMQHDDMTLVGSSPEMLVRVRDGEVVTRPIAGTRRRGVTTEEDAFLEAELLADPKERAEHVMLVDLARNDIGRVVEFGSESVDELMIVERYSHVMHIVSSVSGRLAPGNDCIDVLRATFPAGTVTGAPKVRAMEIIDELEKTKRGPYAGVVGYFDFSGNMDTAITLRTMLAKGGVAYVQAGGGIVADSDPQLELKESENKAKAVLAAISAAGRLGAVSV